MRLSLTSSMETWFKNLLEDTLEVGGIREFDNACQEIMDELFKLIIKSMQKQKNRDSSFEYDLHQFFRSDVFGLICLDRLPGRLGESYQGCLVLGLSLSRLFSTWLKGALIYIRKGKIQSCSAERQIPT